MTDLQEPLKHLKNCIDQTKEYALQKQYRGQLPDIRLGIKTISEKYDALIEEVYYKPVPWWKFWRRSNEKN